MSIILNKKELATTPLRRDALEILEAGLDAINTEKVLRNKIKFINGELCIGEDRHICKRYERIFFIGIGKCAFEGAKVIEDILGDFLTEGIVLDVKSGILKRIKSFAGTHPYPSKKNMLATKEIEKLVQGATDKDLALVLISGGGSSLLCDPYNTTCENITDITKNLTKKGANIYEMNTVRKHLSEIQGGQLAALAFPAQIISIIFSDVIGNDISVIASGPTVLDKTTADDAKKILEKYHISLPSGKGDKVFDKNKINLIETPKDEKIFEKVKNILIVTNQDALNAMKEKAEKMGYQTKIETDRLSGEARKVGKNFVQRKFLPKTCILAGGETTVIITNEKGKGGRNQETALSALSFMPEKAVFISVASDGWDNTDIAGALVDKELAEKATSLSKNPQDYLLKNNSYHFFKEVGEYISTGITGSNVSDLYILLYN